MKKLKSLLALLLVAALCLTLLAACSKKDDAPANTPAETPEEPEQPDETPEEPEEPEESEEPDEPEEIEEITMSVFDLGGIGPYKDKVEAAINEISEAEIGVHVTFEYWDAGSYVTQIGLAMAGGTPLDIVALIPIGGASLSTLYANGQLMDISSYLAQDYASDMMDIVSDYISVYTFEGSIYGVPTYRIYAANQYLIMRKDILEELGKVEYAENMTNWQEFADLLYEVRDNYDDIWPLVGGTDHDVLTSTVVLFPELTTGGSFDTNVLYDRLGDTLNILWTDSEGNVGLNYLQPAYIDVEKNMAEWMAEGLIYPDTAINIEAQDTLMKQGIDFANYQGSEVGVEIAKQASTGHELVCRQVAPAMVTTAQLNVWGMGVPVIAENPEAAVKFMNLLYSNQQIMNTLVYGVEGDDWYLTETGEADYPDGKTAETAEYHYKDWMLGNQFLLYPWAGQGPDFREVAQQANEDAVKSPYLGFALNVSGMDTTIASITSVYGQYHPALVSGQYTDALQEEYVAAMEAAGVNDYVAMAQEQLDAFLGK